MAELRIRLSRCAPPNWRERWQYKTIVDYSEWICRLTHSPFSHGDLVLDDGNLLGSSDSAYAPVISGNPRGVAIRPPDYERFETRHDLVFETGVRIKKDFTDFCVAQIPKPFDSGALKPGVFLSSNFANRDWRSDDKWFCVEMLGRAAEVSKLIPWPYPGIKNRMTAADFLLWVSSVIDFEKFLAPI